MSTTAEAEVIDGTVVDTRPTTALVRSRTREVLRPLDTRELLQAFKDYQQLAVQLLDASDYQEFSANEKDAEGRYRKVTKKFKKKSAWRKLAAAFDVDVTIVEREVERDMHGRIMRASAIARATAPSGRIQDGDGACSADERKFNKPDHEIVATAVTRAKNRAVSDLLGTGEVSAEEAGDDAEGGEVISATGFGVEVDDAKEAEAAGLIQQMHLSVDGFQLVRIFKANLGVEHLPDGAYRMVKAIKWAISDGQKAVSGNLNTPAESPAAAAAEPAPENTPVENSTYTTPPEG